MFYYVLDTISSRTLHHSPEEVHIARGGQMSGTVYTFSSRSEALAFIGSKTDVLSSPAHCSPISTHVLSVTTTIGSNNAMYKARLVLTSGVAYNFEGYTPTGITNTDVAEVMAYRTVLDKYPDGRFYFVSKSFEIVKTYHNTVRSMKAGFKCEPQGDDISQACEHTLMMMAQRGVILSLTNPLI